MIPAYQPIIPLPDYPGYYVTSAGQVMHIIGNQLLPVPTHKVGNGDNDYIHLQRDGKMFHRAVDRVILAAYAGEHDTYHIVRHADGNMHNCVIDNLSWAPHAVCQTCAAYGEYCREYDHCKIILDAREARKADKGLTPSKQKLQARMTAIALKAQGLDDNIIKPSLIDIINELRKGNFPNEVHSALLQQGRTITVQYVHKVMRMVESNDPRLYNRRNKD